MTELPPPTNIRDLICRKCGAGYMEATIQNDEPEYTENYQCTNCGHSAVIPSIVIITSQILTGILGGATSLYLLFQELLKLLAAFHANTMINMATSLLLILLAIVFFLGFIYTLYRAINGVRLRRQYRSAVSPNVKKT